VSENKPTVEKMHAAMPAVRDSKGLFEPNQAQKMAKVKFWEEIKENAALKPEIMSVDQISDTAGAQRVKTWLKDPRFVAWFFNKNTVAHKIMAATEAAIDTLVKAMDNEDPKAQAARVKAAEIVLKFGGYEPAKRIETEFLDSDVNKMDETQLREFIKRAMTKLPIDITPEKK
jgi:hypothetical protein